MMKLPNWPLGFFLLVVLLFLAFRLARPMTSLEDEQALLLSELDNVIHDLSKEDSTKGVARELDDRLPEVRKQVGELFQSLASFSTLIRLTPESFRIRFAKQRLSHFEEELALFNSLPVSTQERMVGQLLRRNPSARAIVLENKTVLEALDFQFDVERVLSIASAPLRRDEAAAAAAGRTTTTTTRVRVQASRINRP